MLATVYITTQRLSATSAARGRGLFGSAGASPSHPPQVADGTSAARGRGLFGSAGAIRLGRSLALPSATGGGRYVGRARARAATRRAAPYKLPAVTAADCGATAGLPKGGKAF